jgi:hypothetical protein
VHENESNFRPGCTFIEVRLDDDSSRKLDGDREANLDILYDGCWGMRSMSQHTPAGFSIEFLIGKTEMNPTFLQMRCSPVKGSEGVPCLGLLSF